MSLLQNFYQHVFNGCYAVLLFIVVIFFLLYGVEVYFKSGSLLTYSQPGVAPFLLVFIPSWVVLRSAVRSVFRMHLLNKSHMCSIGLRFVVVAGQGNICVPDSSRPSLVALAALWKINLNYAPVFKQIPPHGIL
ncbi:E3 ubiquitin-protein ligase MARCH2 [Danaus plexippus plexippus]|uniref:E3 ubiquitin-protein ligase MARCH2 n=1 Tax=Danaus plexippus plexippus TaxID=278856 RepID=A0A212FQ05_DANPL|nr:E3 ubiquitin-protein ligase MARCH2 [Danaus plexippus plexippus]